MKMGFNWIRGPFEMIDALGADVVIKLAQDAGCTIPQALQTSAEHGPFYQVQEGILMVRNFDQTASQLKPVQLPDGTQRFSLTRRTLTPIASNRAASLWSLPGGLRLVEFHSKANALTGESMAIVRQAAEDHGTGILIHNDAQHPPMHASMHSTDFFASTTPKTPMQQTLTGRANLPTKRKHKPWMG